jgi:hypothetical protein
MLLSAIAFGTLAPANVPAHRLDMFDRSGWPAQIGRHIGEIDARHRFRTATSCTGRTRAKRCRQQHGRYYPEHASLLIAGAKGRPPVLKMIGLIFSHESRTINEEMLPVAEVA